MQKNNQTKKQQTHPQSSKIAKFLCKDRSAVCSDESQDATMQNAANLSFQKAWSQVHRFHGVWFWPYMTHMQPYGLLSAYSREEWYTLWV